MSDKDKKKIGERGQCKDCAFWKSDDGKPYCVILPLYTHTKPFGPCRDKDVYGNWLFVPND